MEDQLVNLLAQTHSAAESPRRNAEEQLSTLYDNPHFPLALIAVAGHAQVQLEIRQSALLTLKAYVLAGWSSQFDEFRGQIFPDDTIKGRLRESLLDLATSDNAQSKIQAAASNVVAKIAYADLPDAWSGLLPTLLGRIHSSTGTGLHGALKVLAELVQDGFDESQFFQVASDLVNVLHMVASDGSRNASLRALATSIFKDSFKIIEMILEENKSAVKTFAEQTITQWTPFLLEIVHMQLPTPPLEKGKDENESSLVQYRGLVSLKIQVVGTLVTIRTTFPMTLSMHAMSLFTSMWQELMTLQALYKAIYIENDREGRLEDADGLPYTLDFLILEDLDLLQACLKATSVRKELDAQIQQNPLSPTSLLSNPITQLLAIATNYAQITLEEEGMWSVDANVFLAEEISVTTNYTPRIACGDMVVKLNEWLRGPVLDAMLLHIESVYSEAKDWRPTEAALYLLDQVLHDWSNVDRELTQDVSNGLLAIAQQAQQQQHQPFLRARGVIVLANVMKASNSSAHSLGTRLLDLVLELLHSDDSEVVQMSCIQALQLYLQSLPQDLMRPYQRPIVQSLQQWIASKDFEEVLESDDLLISLVETLRDAILLDIRVCLDGEGLNLLFNMASQGADSFQMVQIVSETFEDICSKVVGLGDEAYVQLCQKVLPSLTGAFDVGNLTEENALTNLAADLLASLAKFGPQPLPPGFIGAVMPKLKKILLTSSEEELLKTCTSTVRNLLKHDQQQLFEWKDEQSKGGLELVLMIIDRLLNPSVDDNAAAEVGGLAAELVEKAGSDQLGPYLMQLLQAVAMRMNSAEKPHLIQSLSTVFARLSLTVPRDVVTFLSQVQVGSSSGLEIVMSKWLENSATFAGYDDIRQNIFALSKIYQLHDPRLQHLRVKGDLVVPQSDQIMTRSKARKTPDQYTVTSVPVKILKLLVDELVTGSVSFSTNGLATNASLTEEREGGDDEDSDEEEWEDEPAEIGLGLGLGMSKQDLIALTEDDTEARRTDDETQTFLRGFFRDTSQEEGFDNVFQELTISEQTKLRATVQ